MAVQKSLPLPFSFFFVSFGPFYLGHLSVDMALIASFEGLTGNHFT